MQEQLPRRSFRSLLTLSTYIHVGDAGAVAEAEHKFAWSEFEQPIRLARRAKTREGFRNEK